MARVVHSVLEHFATKDDIADAYRILRDGLSLTLIRSRFIWLGSYQEVVKLRRGDREITATSKEIRN